MIVVLDHYQVNKLLAYGHYSETHRGIDTHNQQQVAIKKISWNFLKQHKVYEEKLKNKIRILKSLGSHENIVRWLDLFATSHNCYVAYEHC
jgi:serine/threonine protein kinase